MNMFVTRSLQHETFECIRCGQKEKRAFSDTVEVDLDFAREEHRRFRVRR